MFSKNYKNYLANNKESGQLTLAVLLFSFVAIIILSGLIIWVDVNLKSAYRSIHRDSAFRIAEAGIEYYRWHLAHAPLDFQDGTGQAGPYTHDFYDKSGNIIGKFKLEITPPPLGSTVVTIRSTGTVEGVSGLEKTIEIKMAKPSFAKYAVVLNDNVRFGPGTDVFGQIHSNGGIRFDGLAHNIVTSAVPQYDDPDHSGSNEFGVHTHIAPTDPIPPAPVPSRTDVFMAGRQSSVPAVDFAGITQSLSQIKTGAQASGRYFGPSGASGYDIVLKTNDTFDLYRINTLVVPPSGCTNYLSQSGWGTWSIQGETLLGNYSIPANGLVFIEDNTWVRGQINTARITIGSGRFPDNPATRSSITVTSDILYTNYDGQDIMSLISQNNINIGMVSDTDLRIDAAIIAQNGRVGRYYYRPSGGGSNRCSPYHSRSAITSYGMIGSYQRYGFAYTDGTGYQTRSLIYDSFLLYGPPPSFPLTSDYYEQIFWNEVK
ncbi:MAG: hypothetical protein Q7S43_05415 [bacterium]|nr:hypothetical protein [bacterium]